MVNRVCCVLAACSCSVDCGTPVCFFRLMASSSCRRGLCVVIVCQCVLRKKKSLVVDGGLAHLPTTQHPHLYVVSSCSSTRGHFASLEFFKASAVQLLQGLKRRTTLLPLALISNNKTVKVLEYKHSSATSTIAFGGGVKKKRKVPNCLAAVCYFKLCLFFSPPLDVNAVFSLLQSGGQDQERRHKKRRGEFYSIQTSLIVAALKKMLPIGLNMCTPGDQELISLAKTRYLLVRRNKSVDDLEQETNFVFNVTVFSLFTGK